MSIKQDVKKLLAQNLKVTLEQQEILRKYRQENFYDLSEEEKNLIDKNLNLLKEIVESFFEKFDIEDML